MVTPRIVKPIAAGEPLPQLEMPRPLDDMKGAKR
jgi:hypothetical protein